MGPMQEIMGAVYTTYRSRHLDTTGNYYIYSETSAGKQTNDKNVI